MKTSRWVLGATAALLLTSRLAHADAAADETAARALFREAVALHEARDYAGAIEKYSEAYSHWKNPKILMNIGTAAFELGRYAESASAYDRFLVAADARDPNRVEVEKALRDVLPRIATLDVQVNGGTAVVTLDGHSVEETFVHHVRAAPGSHTVEAMGSAGRAKQTVSVVAGQTLSVPLTLGTAEPGSSSPPPPEAAGPHRDPGLLPWVVGGAGVASLVTSGVFFALRSSATTDLDAQCLGGVCPASSQSTIDRANTFGLVSAITLVTGLAGVGAGVYFYFKPLPASDAPASVEVHGSAVPGGGRATATLRF